MLLCKPVMILNDEEAATPTSPVNKRGKEVEEDDNMLIGDVELEEFYWAAADAEVDAEDSEDGDGDGDEDNLMDSTDER